jgi:hypothetical protein
MEVNGYSKLGLTNTELGDRVEAALASQPGWKALVGKSAGAARQGAFDIQAPDGAWCELKACAADAAEWKIKSKAREITSKVRAAAEADRQAASLIAIVFDDLSAVVFRREGLGCFRLAKSTALTGKGPTMWRLVANLEAI